MAIFSWLFSKDTEKNSQIRKWVAKEIEQVSINHSEDYAIFVDLINTATQWGKYNSKEENDQSNEAAKQYLGDATIFEIVCYTYFRLESWLVENQPGFKADLALPISKWIVEKFSLTFYLNEHQISLLLAEKLSRYQMLMEAGQGLADMHLELAQGIVMTKGDKFNQKKMPKDSVSTATDSQYIIKNLAQYEENCIPKIIIQVQEYCTKHTKKQIKQELNKQQNHEEKDYLYGMALVAQGDGVRACKALTKVINENPTHYDAFVQRGLLYIKLHQPVDAVQDFTMAIKVKPNEAAAYIQRGRCYHRHFRQKDQSLADYAMAIQLAPKEVEAHLGRGELYDDIALSHEKQALENNDHTKQAHVSDEALAAIRDYSQTIALDPKNDHAYVKRALLYARQVRINKDIDFAKNAIADFEEAMRLNWEHGYLYKQQEEMQELVEQDDCVSQEA